jgi:hypothetical protein
MKRNQAYSNLVELMFPNHIRLSIHAHNNSGPKFGIQLFDKSQFRTTESLDPSSIIAASSVDLLHIPTPWHNSVVQVAGSPYLYVTKSKVVADAIASKEFSGTWIEGGTPGWLGGFYSLQSKRVSEQLENSSPSRQTIAPEKPTKAVALVDTPKAVVATSEKSMGGLSSLEMWELALWQQVVDFCTRAEKEAHMWLLAFTRCMHWVRG